MPIISQSARRTLKAWGIFSLCMLVILVGVGAVLWSLGARWEHPDLSPAAPTAPEQERQSLAILAQRIAASGSAAPADPSLATAAHEWAADLGGVWVPWPKGAPEGYSNPTLNLTAFTGPQELSTALWQFITAAENFSSLDTLNIEKAARSSAHLERSTTTEGKGEDEQSKTPSAPPAAGNATAGHTAALPLGRALALAATTHAVAIDTARGAQPRCPKFSALAVATLTLEQPQALQQLESTRQLLELQQAGRTATERAPLHAAITTLGTVVDSVLAAGAPDVRPLFVRQPSKSPTPESLIDSAVAALATPAAPSKETASPSQEAEHTAVLVGLKCQLLLDLAGKSRT
ncbi:MAG: hypothetical protein MR006_05345 [Arcanobacterium sp.]|nr:hypothetical protein [Arcanobacterium sp.]